MVTLEAGILIVLLMAACIVAAWIQMARQDRAADQRRRSRAVRRQADLLWQSWERRGR